jgi:hypothetical protein
MKTIHLWRPFLKGLATWTTVAILAWILSALLAGEARAEGAPRVTAEDLKPRLRDRNGEFVTELGMGYKMPRTTSLVLVPECETALVRAPTIPEYDYLNSSCGGDNPAFIGWPVAYEWQVGDVYSVRAGWFHYSNWFDGGSDRETHMDLLAVTVTIHWGRLRN